jgi:lipopolysaccharide/colanic/teichoic acid biosynthesis glycosyltransferase
LDKGFAPLQGAAGRPRRMRGRTGIRMTRDYKAVVKTRAGEAGRHVARPLEEPIASLTPAQWALARRALCPAGTSPGSKRTRAVDRVVAVGTLIAATPLLTLAALLIFLESPGPVLLRQIRVGKGGRPFVIYKLRTMRRHAADLLGEVATIDNVHAGLGDTRMFKAWSDPRVLRVGALLRALAIDELPQLVNVVRGDMALVGPRPLTPDEDRWVCGRALARRSVPPGISGLWQVAGGNEIGFEGMVFLDELYVERRSLRQDLRLLAATPRAMVRSVRAWRRGCTG